VRLSNWGTETGEERSGVVSLEEMLATPYWKVQEATDVLALAEERSRRPIEECEIAVVTLGDGAITMVPFELFVEFGLEIKKLSPYEHTMVVELANGNSGYVPTRKAFSRPGGYETLTLRSSKLSPAAGDTIVAEVANLLTEL
jgi:hypothetical protein